MPKLFDIHSHINFNAFKKDGDEVIKKTLENGVWTILVGSQYDTSKRAVEYAEKYTEGIYATIGLHPFHLIEQEIKSNDWEINADSLLKTEKTIPTIQTTELNIFKTRPEKFDEQKYLELAKSPKVVAIGECGLDYYHIPQNNNLTEKERRGIKPLVSTSIKRNKNKFLFQHSLVEIKNFQIETFEKQIELALKLNKPLMIHCREAHNKTIEILKKYKPKYGNKLRGDIHFFTGNLEQSKQYFDLDFSISFTGVITFTRDYDEIIKKSPLERIMIETDSPYVTPVPYRGKRNEPIFVKEICYRIAEIKNISFEETAETTTKNAIEMFLKNVL